MTQIEFDKKMQEYNLAQYQEKKAFNDANEQLNRDIATLRQRIRWAHDSIQRLQDKKTENNRKIKEINFKYHTLKHELIVEHPKDTME